MHLCLLAVSGHVENVGVRVFDVRAVGLGALVVSAAADDVPNSTCTRGVSGRRTATGWRWGRNSQREQDDTAGNGLNTHDILSGRAYAGILLGKQTYGGIVHRDCVDGKHSGKRENDTHEARPEDAVHVRDPADDAVTHIEWPRRELDLGVVPVPPAAASFQLMAGRFTLPVGEIHDAPEDRDNIRQIQRHSGHREDGIERDRAREVE